MKEGDSNIHLGDMTGYIARLNDQMTTLREPVKLAWGMESLDNYEGGMPAILVYPSDQFSTQSGDSYRCRQSMKYSVTNLVICKIDDLPPVIGELRDAIVGWAPDAYSEQFKFTHRNIRYAGPMDIKADYIWWMELYESSKLHVGQ